MDIMASIIREGTGTATVGFVEFGRWAVRLGL